MLHDRNKISQLTKSSSFGGGAIVVQKHSKVEGAKK